MNRSSGERQVETMLLNSKCKAVSDESYSNEDDRAKYCVRKGNLLYQSTDDGLFQFRYTVSKDEKLKKCEAVKSHASVKRGKTVREYWQREKVRRMAAGIE